MKKSKNFPEFWWDFEGYNVIVESDDPKYPLIAFWKQENKKDATKEIELALKLIESLKNKEVDYRVLAKSFDKKFIKKMFPNYVYVK